MFKKVCPEFYRRVVQQGRSRFDARSVLPVRERERSEERQACEPEGQAKGRPMPGRAASAKPENAAGGFFQHSLKRKQVRSRYPEQANLYDDIL